MMRNEESASLWKSPEDAAREIASLASAGDTRGALQMAERAAQRFERSPLAQTNLGYMRIVCGNYAGALQAYERALALAPNHAEALRGRSVARLKLGEAVTGASLSVLPYTGPANAIPVKLLVLLGSGSGHVIIDELFDSRFARVTKLMLDLHGGAALPKCDVIFNAVGDADGAPDALALAETIVRDVPVPVLNHPARVAQTGRADQAARLDRLGARTPKIERVDRAGAAACALPVLLRAPGFHAGEHFERVLREAERTRALETIPGSEFFAIEWIDTRDAEGIYAKYRVIAVDGVLYPGHLALSRHWKVHYFSAEMASNAAYRERERRYLSDPVSEIGSSAWSLLERIVREVGLEYAGIDFALDAAGKVVIFECNATMAVRYPPDEAIWSYRRPAVDAIRAAVRSMLERYSSTETLPP